MCFERMVWSLIAFGSVVGLIGFVVAAMAFVCKMLYEFVKPDGSNNGSQKKKH
jgi:hypothetical protein